MFKTHQTKGEATRAHVYSTALELFRENGFEKTTMRDIAAKCELAVGAAYHYFPSKDAIVLAYYDEVQRRHTELAEEMFAAHKDMEARISRLHHLKLDILETDRAIMGALLRYAGDPESELSFLGKPTEGLRQQCMQLFMRATEGTTLPEDVERMLPSLLWSVHMGILLYFLYDKSPNQAKTRKLIDRSTSLLMTLLKTLKNPLLKPVRKKAFEFLREFDLVAELPA
jgi:AcrR family transcriptional regulator